MKINNPATGKMITEIKADNRNSVLEKFNKLKLGQKEWVQTDISQRISCIQKFCDLLKDNLEELALELTREVGKPISESRGEILGAIKKTNFFIKESEGALKENTVNQDGNTEEIIGYDPLGVITNISAWNYPYLVGINIFIPALVCGNAVLYKPSEFSTMVGLSITKFLHQAGIPENVFQPVIGAGDVGAVLLDLPLDGYFFTGSYKTGKLIATKVAPKLVPVGLELGGKDPLYVTDDVDVKSVASAAVEGAFYNNGQSCCSVERIYVHESVYDEFLKLFIEGTRNLKMGNPESEETQMGAITRPEHLDFLDELVSDAVALGAKVECGGSRVEGEGSFYSPTVLTNVSHQMKAMTLETFGPIIGIQKVENDEQALQLMNDSEYGLTSAVFTNDAERGEKILRQINSGSGYLNCCDRVSGYLPWSGRGHSGLGSTLSKHGLYAFCQPKGFHFRR